MASPRRPQRVRREPPVVRWARPSCHARHGMPPTAARLAVRGEGAAEWEPRRDEDRARGGRGEADIVFDERRGLQRNTRLGAPNVWELSVSLDVIAEAKSIYE